MMNELFSPAIVSHIIIAQTINSNRYLGLFVAGCGKFFEGTADDMYLSLYEKLASLPSDTSVYCGHEYTLSNYKFALSIDSTNDELIKANEEAKILREQGKPTIPSTIGKELKTNPFLRCKSIISFG